jgi:carboxymethylenebutenolidase
MELFEEIIDIPTDEGEMAVVITQPIDSAANGGTWPTVMIMIDAPGIRKATHEFMAKLATAGYRVITPDLHHRQGRMVHVEPEQVAADPSLRGNVQGWIAAMTDEQIQRDIDQALAATGADQGPLGAIGFCLGARAVVRAMTRLPDRFICAAGWHPSFLADDKADSPHRTPEQIVGDLYLGIGDADQVQSIAMHQRFLHATAEMSNVDVDIWPGADHGFTWPGYATYDEAASEGCWAKTIALFERTLT